VGSDERLRIVQATAGDAAVVLRMIKGLAEYEKLSDRVVATEATFPSFSTFACRPGIYVEDLFIEPKWRGRGFGRQLLAHVARTGVARGCDRMNWAVLPWNESAIDFYRRLEAERVTEWEGFKIAGEAFERLAREGE
jgi:GNAT superfamily N-acetyltransferase